MSTSIEHDGLLAFVEQVSGESFLKIDEDLGSGFVRLKTSEAERRQARHDIRTTEDIIVELLRNSRDANSSQIFVAMSSDGQKRILTIIDDGDGIPSALRDAIFEPRVTSKLETMTMDEWGVHGRGMALFSIRENVEEATLLDTFDKGGSVLKVVADTSKLKELSDQSTRPKIGLDENNEPVVESGPHNIVRKVTEFALSTPAVEVYFGSPAEIAATLRSLGSRRYKSFAEAIAAPRDISKVPLWERLSIITDVPEVTARALALGLPISSRNAYRIVRNEIAPLPPILEASSKSVIAPVVPADIYKDSRGLKIHSSDIAAFQLDLEKSFDSLAQKYYLSLSDDIKVSVKKDCIRVTIPFEKEQ